MGRRLYVLIGKDLQVKRKMLCLMQIVYEMQLHCLLKQVGRGKNE